MLMLITSVIRCSSPNSSSVATVPASPPMPTEITHSSSGRSERKVTTISRITPSSVAMPRVEISCFACWLA
ncbi:Uncharacterised protein [Raoultella ornithinolytica]|nr:Uncharacterised protein [Raoultella ornithinolytica]